MTSQAGRIFPAPSDFGLPERYSVWRGPQELAFEQTLTTERSIVAMVAPTGFGKTVLAETLCMFWGARTAYLVGTKALQDQIAREFAHRFDIRGKQNFDCRLLLDNGVDPVYAKCDQAEALCGGCAYRDKGCLYFDALRGARQAPHLLTNYSMWFAMARYSEEGLGEFNALVIDEAHNVPDQLCKAMRVELGGRVVEQFTNRPLPAQQPLSAWRKWAGEHAYTLAPRLEAARRQAESSGKLPRELKDLAGLVGALQSLAAASDDWVEDRTDLTYRDKVGFEPVWPAPYASRLLFRGIKHMLLMSATLRPKTLEMLGLDRQEVEFLEYPSEFPVSRRPIIHVKTVQHRASMTHSAKLEAVRRVDQLIGARADRKGLIDTVSFDRAGFLAEHSQWSWLMVRNSPGKEGLSAAAAMDQFKRATPPRLLVGPSFRTGYDLPGELAEYAILYKVPFLDGRNPLTKARRESDPLWEKLVVMVEIVQFFGRIMRHRLDRGEGLIVDDMFVWMYWECLKLGYVPGWFAPAVRLNQSIPMAPPKLHDDEEEGG